MAPDSVFGNLKEKARSMYYHFFYEKDAPERRPREEAPAPPDQGYTAQPEAPWQYPQVQQPAYLPQQQYPTYQHPQAYQAQGYQQQVYQQPVNQQPAQTNAAYQQAPQPYTQPAPQQRNRRMQQRATHEESNIVDFGVYQQQQYAQQAPAHQQQEAPVQPQMAQMPLEGVAASARILNARGMADCRSAISLLRSGDTVLITMESMGDPAEMRRLVDTLSGACYSLTATITKVSRYGVYLLAPQNVAVYADQITNQMNSAPGRAPVRNYQPGYSGQVVTYQTQPQPAPQQNAYAAPQQTAYAAPQQSAYAPQQGFTQRGVPSPEAAQPFYARTAPQAAPPTVFAPQQAGYGYAPDEGATADQ